MIEKSGSYSYSESKSLDQSIEDLKSSLSKYNLQLQQIDQNEEQTLIKILSEFSIFENYDKVTLFFAMKLSGYKYNTYLLLITFNSQDQIGLREIHTRKNVDCELLGLTSINSDLGHVLIRPETFSDKVVELLSPSEVDFDEAPKFSRKYYVLADNAEKLRKGVNIKFLNAINEFKDLHIEIKDSYVLSRTYKAVVADTVSSIVGILENINDINSQ